MAAISIIICVYNAEKTLKRCIESILAQTFNDFEVIIINDGSTDKCIQIIEDYKSIDNRIKVISQKNCGVACARQIGLVNSTGDFITTIDSDDWIEPDALKQMYECAVRTLSDITICDYYTNSSAQIAYLNEQHCDKSDAFAVLRKLMTNEIKGFTWNKLFRLSFIKKHLIQFTTDFVYCEDLFFCIQLCQANAKITFLNKAFYHYDLYSQPCSLSRTLSQKSVENYRHIIEWLNQHISTDLFSEEITAMKIEAKRIAFRSNCSAEFYYNLYPDVTPNCHDLLANSKKDIPTRAEIFALNGWLKMGRLILKCYNRAYLPLAITFHRMIYK